MTDPEVIGRAWMLARGNTNNPQAAMDAVSDTAEWIGEEAVWGGIRDLDLRIVLDTTAGAGFWTTTWYAKASSDPGYSVVRATTDLATEDITSVGFAVSGGSFSGTLNSFSLTENVIPEPASAALLGLGGLLIAGRRRR